MKQFLLIAYLVTNMPYILCTRNLLKSYETVNSITRNINAVLVQKLNRFILVNCRGTSPADELTIFLTILLLLLITTMAVI